MATPWRRWSRFAPALVAGAVLAVGVVSERARLAFGIDRWLPDLAVGICLIVSGALITRADPRSRLGVIVVLAGLAWYVPNFEVATLRPLAVMASGAIVLHRAVLFHAIVSFPDGRIRRPVEGAVVVLAYLTALGDVSRDAPAAILWSVATLGAFVAIVLTRAGPGRDAGLRALPAMGLLTLVIGGTGVLLLLAGSQAAPPPIAHLYEAGIAAVGVVLAVTAAGVRSRHAGLTGAAVELTQGRAGYVRDLLADALRDPSVEVAFAVEAGSAATWVDELGRPIEALRASGSRSVLPILVDGRLVAQLSCESSVADEPAVRASLEAAARLAARNARLRAGVRGEADRIRASQLRLLSAADEQRIALAGELARGAGASMAELGPLLDSVPEDADPAVRAAVERSRARVAGLATELRSLSAGLGPNDLRAEGLEAALRRLGEGFEARLTLDVETPDLPDRLAVAAWFICAEGIANATKHAHAATVAVKVQQREGRLLVSVVDDGIGGAAIDAGSGIRGLADRVAALGGSLLLVSPAGEGTRLAVDLPLG